jgi:DNA (cytosine-5)-methyltransferase 1
LTRPLLLDLFCGAGGAGEGYRRAGFDVVGVDHRPQPRYPFEFWQADALEFLGRLVAGGSPGGWMLGDFAAAHASPPCQAYSRVTGYHPGARAGHPDLIGPTRERLEALGLPFVIENVEGAPLRRDMMLCGEMFGLRVHRHRVFELGEFFAMQPRHSPHRLKGARHNCHVERGHARLVAGHYADHDDASEAMGVDWMARDELAQAIPPAYCEHIGGYLLAAVSAAVPTGAARPSP